MLATVHWYWEVHPIRWGVLIAAAVAANVLSYFAKAMLRSNGFPVSHFWHIPDLPNMHRLIRREMDPARRHRALFLLVALYISIGVFLVFGIQFFFAPPAAP